MANCSSCAQKRAAAKSIGTAKTKKIDRKIVTSHSKFGTFTVTPKGGRYAYGRSKKL